MAACGGGPTQTTAEVMPVSHETRARRSPIMGIAPFRLVDERGVGFAVDDTGTITMGDGNHSMRVGGVYTDGRIIDTGGNVRATLDADGRLLGDDEEVLVRITETGSLDDGSGTLRSWADDGSLTLPNGQVVRIEPLPEDPAVLRTAAAILYLHLTPEGRRQRFEGTLAEGDLVHPADGSFYDDYEIEADAGQHIELTMRSSDFDAYLQLRIVGRGDEFLVEDDDGREEGATDAAISVIAPETASYVVWANSAAAGETGSYTLEVSVE